MYLHLRLGAIFWVMLGVLYHNLNRQIVLNNRNITEKKEQLWKVIELFSRTSIVLGVNTP